MAPMARTKPATEVPGLANRHTTQMGAHAQHDEPLGFLDAVLIGLGIAEGLNVDRAGVLNLGFGAVSDEDGLAAPLDDYLQRRLM